MATDQAQELLDRMHEWWQAGERHAIVITGNTGDDLTLGDETGRLSDVLASHLGRRFDVVLRYDLASGLRIEHGEANLRSDELGSQLPLENALPADAIRVARDALVAESGVRVALLIDGVDDLVPGGPTGAITDRACVQQLERLGDDRSIAASEHLIVAICADPTPGLGRLTEPSSRWLVIDIPPPDDRARLAAIEAVLDVDPPPTLVGIDPQALARLTRGMTCTELRHELLTRRIVDSREVHHIRARAIERSSSGLVEVIEPREGGWSEAPGLDHVRRAFDELIAEDGSFSRFVGDGVLLAGPPGCGKSIAIRALAAERPIVCLSISDLRTRWYGESERNFTRLERILRAHGQTLVFMDEFDQMVGRRGESGDGTHDVDRRLFGRFLAFMEESRRDGSVLWVGATNRPDAIDDAMIARLSRVLPVLLPGPRARTQILAAIARSLGADDREIDWEVIAQQLPNAASRDLEHVVRRSALATSGELTQEAVEAVVSSWRAPGSLDVVHAWSLAALKHVRFGLDMPPTDDLPEHLAGFGGVRAA
jgi:ATPase family associated with various cellular activities (AAA)